MSQDGKLPRVLAQAWGLEKAAQRGPKAELSLDAIVTTAVRVADAEGLDAVTMARVARELGFTPMSLYRHVAGKDDLLQHMNDAPLGVRVPTAADEAGLSWRQVLENWTRALRLRFLQHPWTLDIPVAGTPSMPHNVRVADWALRGMRELPMSDTERISLLLTLSALASSFARIDVQLMSAVAQRGTDEVTGTGLDQALAHVITAAEFPDMNRLITAGSYFGQDEALVPDTGPPGSPVEVEFEFALSLVLDGLAARVGG